MEKKEYAVPEFEWIEIQDADLITASPNSMGDHRLDPGREDWF